MSSSLLLRKTLDKSEPLDTALKWSLLERVNDCVKELQLKCTAERSNSLSNDEATNSFLWVLEAIFIHGLSNSFLKSSMSPFTSLLSSFASATSTATALGRDNASPQVPNPSFWEFVLVFLHRDIIDQINSLHLIHTDVGRCRAWLRIALNEGLLQSFLDNMTLKSNRRCLKAFYRSSAFLRDPEKCDILKNYLMGIELLQFKLVINNSFLNHWNSGPLSLVGLWVDENESIQQGVDVANNIESKEFQAIPKLHQRQNNNSTTSIGTPPRFYSELDSVLRKQPPPLLSEDDALRIILSSSPRSPQPPTPAQPPPKKATTSESKPKPPSSDSRKSATSTSTPSMKDASLNSSQKKGVHEAKTESIIEKTQNSTAASLSLEIENGEEVEECKEVEVEVKVTVASPVSSTSTDTNLHDMMASSPAVVGASGLPAQFSTSVSSIEPESPSTPAGGGEEEKSYADLLLNYQQRNHQSSAISEMVVDQEISVNEESNEKKLSTATTTTATTGSGNVSTTSGTGSSSSAKKKLNQSGVNSSAGKRANYSLEELSELLHLFRQICDSRGESSMMEQMELLPRISKFTKVLANEVGLDTQNYACQMCSTSIGMIYGEARLCHFTGALYCASCHLNQEKVIPARVLLNWDFAMYPVCKEANDFLENLKDEPMFDVQEINPLIYSEIDEFNQAKALRTKLFYIGMYLKTCKNSKALEQLRTETGTKEHLLDSIHIYSLSDLMGIPNRTFLTAISKYVSTGSGHILSCTICREKGFICEVCRKPQVIFPFELEKIYKCGGCGAVYHNTCMDYSKNCPRCERWKKHESALSNQNDDDDDEA